MAGLLPPGEKRFKVAAALGLLDIEKLEDRVAAKLWRLRDQGRKGGRMKISEVADYLEARGEHTSIAWLSEVYATTKPREPVA